MSWAIGRRSVCLVVCALAVVASGTRAMAQTCVDDITGNNNVCTAEDVKITSLGPRAGGVLDPCTGPGDTTTVELEAVVLAGSDERYDIGFFLALDGGDAFTGNCLHTFLTPLESAGNPNDPSSGIGPYYNGEVGDPDVCGDVEQGVATKFYLPPVTMDCVDLDSDGLVDMSAIVSWDNNTNTDCGGVNQAVPGTVAKCRAQVVNTGVPVNPTTTTLATTTTSTSTSTSSTSIAPSTTSSSTSTSSSSSTTSTLVPPPTTSTIVGPTTTTSTSTSTSTSSSSSTSSSTVVPPPTTSTSTTTSTTVPPMCPCDLQQQQQGTVPFLVERFGAFNNGADILSSLGANAPGGYIHLGQNAFMVDGAVLAADRAALSRGASVDIALVNALRLSNGATVRGATAGVTLPLVDPFCPMPPISCGGPDVTVPPGGMLLDLPPGAYGRIVVMSEGRLVLAGGNYTFCSVNVGANGLLRIEGAMQSNLNVAGDVTIANGAALRAAATSSMPVLNVAGARLRVGQQGELLAMTTAPDAKLSMGRHSHIGGSFCVESARTDKNIVLDCPCAP